MPNDIDVFRSLSPGELKIKKNELERELKTENEKLSKIDKQIDDAINSGKDWQGMVPYWEEQKQRVKQTTLKLAMVSSLIESSNNPAGSSLPVSTIGLGTVSIRPNDQLNRKIPGAKTYEEILAEAKREKESKEASALEAYKQLWDTKQSFQTTTNA